MLESPLLQTTSGYLDGKWCAADSARTMPVTNPATGETIALEGLQRLRTGMKVVPKAAPAPVTGQDD